MSDDDVQTAQPLGNGVSHRIVREVAMELAAEAKTFAAELCRVANRSVDSFERIEIAGLHARCIEENIRAICEALADNIRPGTFALPYSSTLLARQCAQMGISIEALIRSGHVGGTFLSGRFEQRLALMHMDSATVRDVLAATNTVTTFLWEYSEVLFGHMTAEYTKQRDQWARNGMTTRVDTVRSILDCRDVSIETAGKRLDYDLRGAQRALILWSERIDGALDARLEQILTRIANALSHQFVWVPLSDSMMAGWVAGGHGDQVEGMLRHELNHADAVTFSVSLGEQHRGIEGFRRSHREAAAVVRVTGHLGWAPGRLVQYQDVALAALATVDPEEAAWFVDDQLGALASDDEAMIRLLETLRVYLREGASPSRAARRLCVHEKTVSYRIRQVEHILSRSVAARRLELEVAVTLASLRRRWSQ